MTQPHDRGQYPRRSLPEINPQQMGVGFRDFMNLESSASPSRTCYPVENESLHLADKPLDLLDTTPTWPSPSSSFLVSGSPITVQSPVAGLESDLNLNDRSLSPTISRSRPARPSSAGVRNESPSPNRERSERSSSARNRDRSWSPPIYRDKSVTLPANRDYSNLKDSFSLPDISSRTYKATREKRPEFVTELPSRTPKASINRDNKLVRKSGQPSVTISVSSASSLTDTSSSLTSTLTSAPPTCREVKLKTSIPQKLSRGLSPPVRDSGSSLTTVTSLTDQQVTDSARDSNGKDSDCDRRLSFDMGFLDILTVDSNSSVVDQLSTGRVSANI